MTLSKQRKQKTHFYQSCKVHVSFTCFDKPGYRKLNKINLYASKKEKIMTEIFIARKVYADPSMELSNLVKEYNSFADKIRKEDKKLGDVRLLSVPKNNSCTYSWGIKAELELTDAKNREKASTNTRKFQLFQRAEIAVERLEAINCNIGWMKTGIKDNHANDASITDTIDLAKKDFTELRSLLGISIKRR